METCTGHRVSKIRTHGHWLLSAPIRQLWSQGREQVPDSGQGLTKQSLGLSMDREDRGSVSNSGGASDGVHPATTQARRHLHSRRSDQRPPGSWPVSKASAGQGRRQGGWGALAQICARLSLTILLRGFPYTNSRPPHPLISFLKDIQTYLPHCRHQGGRAVSSRERGPRRSCYCRLPDQSEASAGFPHLVLPGSLSCKSADEDASDASCGAAQEHTGQSQRRLLWARGQAGQHGLWEQAPGTQNQVYSKQEVYKRCTDSEM